ncbi:type III PLP-dependent enzyme domain-containing protein [Fodinicola feengrottensis]|uniref:hypothetical protein n=1 Tax=Fodinicola feengrottensis TaxID=435914 RepID=UPI0013D07D5A|nr:hypothetical protein [Fodinicola feengrottensis]
MHKLAPRIHPAVRSLLTRGDLLGSFGTPANVVFPQVFKENVESFRETLARYPVASRLFYAHKVNQSTSFVRAAAEAGIGIDVASVGELHHAVAAGFDSERIEATGPKGAAFLWELTRTGATVNVDNHWELTEVARVAHQAVPVLLLRLCPSRGRTSRFGTAESGMPALLDTILDHREVLDLRGFSFHLDTNDLKEKVAAIDACLRLFESAYARGLSPRVLDIGGGFRQVFAADPDGFDRYVQALKAGLAGTAESLSWEGNTFGYRDLRGTPTFHRYANTATGTDQLREILDSPLPGQGAAGQSRRCCWKT